MRKAINTVDTRKGGKHVRIGQGNGHWRTEIENQKFRGVKLSSSPFLKQTLKNRDMNTKKFIWKSAKTGLIVSDEYAAENPDECYKHNIEDENE